MKISVAILSFFVGLVAVNAAQVSISDSINLADYTNQQGKALGASGTLTVQLAAQVAETYIGFSDYEREDVCTEYSDPVIPGYPETAECLKSEVQWKPVVNLNFISPFFTAAVGGVYVNLMAPSQSRVDDSCVENWKALTVVGTYKPNAPTAIRIRASCSASAYSDNRGISIKPRALKGATLDVVVAAVLKTQVTLAQELVLNGNQSVMLPYEAVSLQIVPGQVDLSSKLFQYDARLFLK